MRKSAEGYVSKFTQVFTMKVPDRRNKKEDVDFIVTPVPIRLEVKQTSKKGYFELRFVKDVQRKVLGEHGGWMLFVMGSLPAPKGKEAYLVEWKEYLEVETELLGKGIKSITRESAMELFPETSRLEWRDGNWFIPDHHPFWVDTLYRLRIAEQTIEALCRNSPSG